VAKYDPDEDTSEEALFLMRFVLIPLIPPKYVCQMEADRIGFDWLIRGFGD